MTRRTLLSRRVIAVMENEWAQLGRNRVALFTTIAPPLLVMALALAALAFTGVIGAGASAAVTAAGSGPLSAAVDPVAADVASSALKGAVLRPFLVLFQFIPLIVPITIASYSIVGEKQARSLEPLLATPIHTWELLAGKAMAAALPAVLVTWYGYSLFAFIARFALNAVEYKDLIISPAWLLALAMLTPVFTMLAVSLALILSTRVKDPNSAQQLGSLVVTPLVAALVFQIIAGAKLSPSVIVVTSAIISLVDFALLRLAIRLFRREEIFTNWR